MPSTHYVLQNYVPVKLNSTQRWRTDASAMPLCSNWNENFEHSNAKTVSAIQTNQFYIIIPSVWSDYAACYAAGNYQQLLQNKIWHTISSPCDMTSWHTRCKEYVTFALKQHQRSLKSEKARVVNFSNIENIKHGKGNRVSFRRCSVYT